MKRMLSIVALILLGISVNAAAQDQFFDSDGVKIRYIVEGEGEPLVLIHGFSANLDLNFRMPGIIGALTDEYQVIALDCRGHGKSDKPHGTENYGTNMVDDVIRLLDHLDIERAYVSGYSMGGFITMKLIAEHPDRVIAAIPGGAGWPSDDSVSADMREELAVSLENGNGIGPLLEALTPSGKPKPTPEYLAQINSMLTATNDQLALAGVIRGMSDLSVTEAQLKANEVPTLILIGEIDPLKTSVDAAEGVMDNLEVVVLEGHDHMSAFSAPAYPEHMKQFLAQNAATAAVTTD